MRDQNMTENIPIQLGLRVFIQIVTSLLPLKSIPNCFPSTPYILGLL